MFDYLQDGEESTGWNSDLDGSAASAAGFTVSAAGDISEAGDAGWPADSWVPDGEESTGWNSDLDGSAASAAGDISEAAGLSRAAAFSCKWYR